MIECITNCLELNTLGEPQTYKHITVFPMRRKSGAGVRHLTASEAFHIGTISVTEVDDSGSVPELKVVNSEQEPVLILDGEELVGAKQNRVLNTTILVPGESTLVVPVSCTEAGRWDYSSPTFSDSGVVMSKKARCRKARSVSSSLENSGDYTSDQGQVWSDVSELHAKLGTQSPTGAMKDAYSAMNVDIEECLAAFEVQPGQTGVLVTVNGKVLGLDVFSNDEVYSQVHTRLLKSYIIESLVEPAKPGAENAAVLGAETFLKSAARCSEKTFKSIGLGNDHRLHGDGVMGSALVNEDAMVHAAFFTNDDDHSEAPISGFSRRRGYRQ